LSAKHRIHELKSRTIREVTEAGELAFLGPKIKTAVDAFCSFVSVANRESVGSEGRANRLLDSEAWKRLREAVDEIAFYVSAITTTDGTAPRLHDEAEAPTTDKQEPAATVNQRMAGTIMENPEAMGWNSIQWAKQLKCAKSSVVETATWKKLNSARLQAKAERMKDRQRKPKASDSRRE